MTKVAIDRLSSRVLCSWVQFSGKSGASASFLPTSIFSLRACSDDKLQLRDFKSISFFEARHVK